MENIAECVYNSEKTPKIGGVLIMELNGQEKFERLILIFQVLCNPKENVDLRALA